MIDRVAPFLLLLDGEEAASIIGLVGGCAFFVVYLAIIAVILAGMWKVFTKANQPGWACLIPIYNIYVLTQIVGRPAWWLILCLIPCVNIVAIIILSLDLAKSFGKGMGYGIGLAILSPIFYPMLGFGDAKYMGPTQSC